MEPTLRAAWPEFVNVTVCAALLDPTVTEENVRLVGDIVTAGMGVPVPLNVTA
jgi:hypothetical protein